MPQIQNPAWKSTDTKRCPKCNKIKMRSEFHTSKKSHGMSGYCKACQTIISHIYFRNNRPKCLISKKKSKALRILENMIFIREYKRKSGCVHSGCRIHNPLFLTFNHLGNKEGEISNLAKRGVSLRRLIKEINKCEVLCYHHHVLKTAQQLGWYKKIENAPKKEIFRIRNMIKDLQQKGNLV